MTVPLKDSLYNNERVDKGWNILTEEFVAFEQARVEAEAAEAQTVVQAETAVVARFHGDDDDE